MAAKASRLERNRVSYSVLHNLSSVDVLFDETKKRRRPANKSLGFFEAERVIASREDSEGTRYLVKWKGFSCFENTWEPEQHLSQLLLRYFENPKPPQDIVLVYVDKLRVSLLDTIRHKGPALSATLEFRHDVYNYLFKGKGRRAEERNWTLFEENEFRRCKLPNDWNCLYDKHGDGAGIRFPIKMRKFLALSPKSYLRVNKDIIEAPRAYTEKISIKFIKITSSCN